MIKYLLVLLFLGSSCFAQSYNFTKHSVKEGMAQSQVTDMCQDKYGSLWFATMGGVSRYDGIHYYRYDQRNGLPSNETYRVLSDSFGDIWIATIEGISRFNGSEIKNIASFDVQKVGTPQTLVEDSHHTIWVGFSRGVGYLKKDSLYYFDSSNGYYDVTTHSIVEDKDGNILLASYLKGIFKYQDQTFEKVNTLSFPDGTKVMSLYKNSHDRVLAGTNSGIWDITGGHAEKIYPFLSLPVFHMEEDQEGSLWFSSLNGAGKISGNNYQLFGEEQGLTNTWINSIFKDREGTLWFTTDGEGAYSFPPALFTYLNKSSGLAGDAVYTINKDGKGVYWFGLFSFGLSSYDGNKITNYTKENGDISNNAIKASIVDKDGYIWVGTENGLDRFDGEKFIAYSKSDGLSNNNIRTAFRDKADNLWFGTLNGLTKYDGKKFTPYYAAPADEWLLIRCIYEMPDGTLLLSTPRGLYQFSDGNIDKFVLQGLDQLFPLTIMGYKDDIYFGVPNQGIFKYNLNSGKIRKYSVDDGLSSYIIYSLIFDDEEKLWVGTEQGIDRVTFDKAGNIIEVRNYNQEEGFLGIETNGNAAFKDEDGSLWFGSIYGVYKYNRQNDVHNSYEPITYINDIKLFLEDVDWTLYSDTVSSWFAMPKNLTLPYNKNHLTFSYLGNSLVSPGGVKYQYKLDNFDDDWSPVTEERQAVYANLPPGVYTFKVKAANRDNLWVKSPASFSFEITPPFWQTWWFFIAISLTVTVLIKVIYELRVSAYKRNVEKIEIIKNEEKELVRKNMARDFHDEMGNQLASITVFASLIQMKLNGSSSEIKDMVLNIEKASKKLYAGTKDFIWSMDARNDNLNEVFTYLRDFAEEFFRKSSVKFYAQYDNYSNGKRCLPLGASRQIILIFKEAMTNSLKHAEATAAFFKITERPEGFEIVFSDNGKGLPEQMLHQNGLINMRERATRISCQFSISNADQGVCLVLSSKPEKDTKRKKAGKHFTRHVGRRVTTGNP